MLAVHQRMAELWTLRKKRELTKAEQDELMLCMEANATYVWMRIKLENLSLCASLTSDYEWLHEICERIEKLEPKH
ncbi:hypothetical protein ACFPES_04585 [Paenibacillus sp. GCM10023248]|uniref:DUF7667 family protein n=1 Tax=Bacillales TaxID=1385 RepID=UPI0023796D93|nr:MULTISPECIES: hypothetical protein [Bacillales]MDD9266303.1 hypothetical protein [Paenibacillus sp. MAHUQ-63]MDR6878425.1 hypothetical protein [Bacillus sp. 3255]